MEALSIHGRCWIISIRGGAARPPWSRSANCETTTTWWSSILAIAKSRVPDPHRRRSSAEEGRNGRPGSDCANPPVPRSTCATTSWCNLASRPSRQLTATRSAPTRIIRNSAYNWSPMSAAEIRDKTGIEQRRYTSGSIEEFSLRAARSALVDAGVGPDEIGAVIVCTCTSSRLIPSIATWISGALGIEQTHCSFDLVAACAGLSYGLAEAVRILQLVRRPVLVVCAENFSDKIGNVRPSRMIFGDGAAALSLALRRKAHRRTSSTCRRTPAVRQAKSTRSCGQILRSATTSRFTGPR